MGFISFLYKAHWENLVVDDTNMSFRNKVKSKFSPQIVKEPSNNKDKNSVKPSYIFSLPLPILAKSLKKVDEISKFFKKNLTSMQKKSYVQVLSNSNMSNIARKTLKIKEAFPSLQNKKIEQVQKIISGDSKPKPRINMTTKEPSHKQVIVSQTSFSLYLYNQWTDFHKLSCTVKPQIRDICTYVECTKVTTNN